MDKTKGRVEAKEEGGLDGVGWRGRGKMQTTIIEQQYNNFFKNMYSKYVLYIYQNVEENMNIMKEEFKIIQYKNNPNYIIDFNGILKM